MENLRPNIAEVIQDQYSISFVFDDLSKPEGGTLVTGDRIPLLDQASVTEILWKEITKYPPEYLGYAGIETIWLVKSFSRDGKKIGGHGFFDRKGYPKVIFLAADGGETGKIPNLAIALHHELSHAADFQFDVRNNGRGYEILHNEWDELNPSRFMYVGPSGVKGKDPLTKGPTGFIYIGSTLNSLEDRAFLAETLLTNPRRVDRLSAEDPWIDFKVIAIKRLFYDRSLGKMDDGYWKDLLAEENPKMW